VLRVGVPVEEVEHDATPQRIGERGQHRAEVDRAGFGSVGVHRGLPVPRAQWFDLLIQGALVSAATGEYRDFAQIGAASFRALGGTDTERLGATMRSLPAHPDVAAGLDALRTAGHRLVALGNSPLATIRAQLENSGLGLDAFYSAEQAGALKPARAPYAYVLDRENTAPAGAVMVAAHGWDIAGAQAAGLRTVFVARPGRALLPGRPEPDAVVPDFSALVEAPSNW
jgi:2-haloacid dehalogenase